MKSIPISVTILVKNSARTLFECLSALQFFDEVIILDNGSIDNSLQIAKQFDNVVVKEHIFIGFGPMKNLAASYAKNYWVLNIDSDEIVTEELVNSISKIDFLQENIIYRFSRINHYAKKPIKACGLYPDYVNRLYNKKHTKFNDKLVHESVVITDCKVVSLTGELLHYSFDGAEDLINKMQQYSSLFARQQQFKKTSSIGKALLHQFSMFIKMYFLKKGVLYGTTGYTIATANAQGAYYKYIKLYEANKNVKTTLIITTYNRADVLEAVLNSVLKQTRLPDQVIVADDGSTEQTKQVIEKYQQILKMPLIHSWQKDEGFRLARSRNLAIKKSIGDYLVMIDGDMIMHPKFIEDHIKYAKLGQFVQGGRVYLYPEKTEQILERPEIYPNIRWYSKGIDKRFEKKLLSCHLSWLTKLWIKPTRHKHKGIRGCNMAFFKQDVLAINGFNNEFIGWGREDSEFVARLYNNGVTRINLRFAAIAYHLWHKEEDRASLPKNDQLLNMALNQNIIKCDNGLEQL